MSIIYVATPIICLVIVGLIIELIRKGRLKERYAILWLFSSVAVFGLSLSRGLLEKLSLLVGIYYPPSFLFLMAFGFLVIINLHFSTVVSDLSEKNKELAQEVALIREELERRKD